MEKFPDFQIAFNQISNYITSSLLAIKASEKPPFKGFDNVVRELINELDRLSQNCNVPEYKEYVPLHICSMIERISTWGNVGGWLKKLEPKEAGYLLLTVLVHDLGMLSSEVEDIEKNKSYQFCKGLSDTNFWIKNTHIYRLENLLKRLASNKSSYLKPLIKNEHLKIIIALAKAHQSLPWQIEFESVNAIVKANIAKSRKNPVIDPERAQGLATVIAVAELLDEVDNPYAKTFFINRRQGTLTTKANWLRHNLTAGRVEFNERTIKVDFIKPTGSGDKLGQVYSALRNHYRLIKLYRKALGTIDAEIDTIVFNTIAGVPEKEWPYTETWLNVQDWVLCPAEQLLKTFRPEARNEISNEERNNFKGIGLEELDLTGYNQFIGKNEFLTEEEMVFSRLYNYKV